MQTFLPYESFPESARVLDRARLGKQRVEVLQILRTLTGGSTGFDNHPAVRMWRGHEYQLYLYGVAICAEWRARGYQDGVMERLGLLRHGLDPASGSRPEWLGDEKFHASHRAALLHKYHDHYSQFGWTEEPRVKYWWPTEKEER